MSRSLKATTSCSVIGLDSGKGEKELMELVEGEEGWENRMDVWRREQRRPS